MFLRLVVLSISCLVIIRPPIAEAKQIQQVSNIGLDKSLQLSPNDSVIDHQYLGEKRLLEANTFNLNIEQYSLIKLSPKSQQLPNNFQLSNNKFSERLAATSGSYMTLRSTGKTNTLGNPLYKLSLYGNGKLIGTFNTISGRAHTQNRNRNRAGTEAPLPDGSYKVAKTPIPGTLVEAGDRFLPLQPLFQTGRSALGIHYDPSYEKHNGEDGTSGCVALTNRQELSQVLQYVDTYRPKYLEVHIR